MVHEQSHQAMRQLVQRGELTGAALAVNRGSEELWRGTWGWADCAQTQPVTGETLWQLASMTKPIAAVCALSLAERGLLELDVPVTAFLPELHAAVNGEPLMRPVTVRDLLTHSSGLGMSLDGTSWALAHSRLDDTLAERMTRWSGQTIPADFQPGTAAAYSPVVGFELLGRILELAGGKPLDALLRETVLAPLGMVRTGFPDSTQGLARLCQPRSGVLCDVTDEPGVLQPFEAWHGGYFSASAGLCSTLNEYNRFVRMLAGGGTLDGVTVLRPETARLLHREGAHTHLEAFPGCSWGLGLLIFQQPQLRGLAVTPGTYGWSGAYGCHFFLTHDGSLSAVFMMNRADIGGADSCIARLIEQLVFSEF